MARMNVSLISFGAFVCSERSRKRFYKECVSDDLKVNRMVKVKNRHGTGDVGAPYIPVMQGLLQF